MLCFFGHAYNWSEEMTFYPKVSIILSVETKNCLVCISFNCLNTCPPNIFQGGPFHGVSFYNFHLEIKICPDACILHQFL